MRHCACTTSLTLLVIFGILSFCKSAESGLSTVVRTDKGPIAGEILKTVLNSVPYASFRGIPYAKPPTGDLRFQLPQEAEPWEYVRHSTAEGNQCPQMDFIGGAFSGDEDCLYLNVYTPKMDENDLLPVMVALHGGKFATGYANASYYGPDFILEENVVVVAGNFRLDILGFLGLNIPEASENLQLKDQVLILKWVQRNIQKFGGDPNRVTIFGWSSGAVDVDLHMISDVSRGLFHGAIAMSAAPWSVWTFSPRNQSETRVFHLAKHLGINTNNKTTMYSELLRKTAKELVTAGEALTESLIHADRKFKPIIEDTEVAGKSAFLTTCPIKKYKAGEFANVPYMTGYMRNEVLSFAISSQNLYWYVELALKQFNGRDHPVVRKLIHLQDQLSKLLDKKVSELPPELVMQVVNNVTNTLYRSVIDQKQRLVAAASSLPVYYYQNSYDAGENSFHQVQANIPSSLSGAGHGDDLFTMFYVSIYELPLNSDHPLSRARKQRVRMLSNFIKYGNPTPGAMDPLLNIIWPRGPARYLDINEQLTVGETPLDEDSQSIRNELGGLAWEEFNGCY